MDRTDKTLPPVVAGTLGGCALITFYVLACAALGGIARATVELVRLGWNLG